MFDDMVTGFYKLHYNEAISPHLTNDQKQTVANRISKLTLEAPIWLDRDTNHIQDFPELQPYINTKLSGLYLCTIFAAIISEYPLDDPAHMDKLGSPKDIELRLQYEKAKGD